MMDVRRIVAEHRRAVWLIAGGLILNAVLLVLVVLPLSQKVRGGEQQAQAATAELLGARREHGVARATVSGKGQADAELKQFYQDLLPPDQSGARRMLYLSIDQLAHNSKLTVVRYSFQPDTDRQSDLRKLTMTLSLAGEYTNIRRFIHQLETAPEFRVLESVALAQEEEGDRALNVTASVATYYRTGGNGH
jgi:Tfp pilus assembly protein PilO